MKINILLPLILIIVSSAAHAQDKIYKKNGDVINAKIEAVATTTVTYKRFDNLSGPDYTILKKELSQIKYENGTTDNFENREGRTSRHTYEKDGTKKGKFAKLYGDNIISIIPAAYTVSVDGTMNDAGIGVCYERFLDERGHISFNLPVMVNFSSSRDFTDNGIYYANGTPAIANYNNYKSYLLMPGIKFYPASSREKVRYSIEATFFVIYGSEPYAVYDNNNYNGSGAVPSGNYKYTLYGFMLSNSVNITATAHFCMALDLGAGINISDNRFMDNEDDLGGIEGPWVQIGLKVGYRF